MGAEEMAGERQKDIMASLWQLDCHNTILPGSASFVMTRARGARVGHLDRLRGAPFPSRGSGARGRWTRPGAGRNP